VTLQVELVSPEAKGWSGEVDGVLCRILGSGDIQFLTGHAPFLGALDIHPVTMFLPDGTREVIAVRGGFVSVTDNHVKILSDESAQPEHINRSEALEAKARIDELIARDQADESHLEEQKWQGARIATVDQASGASGPGGH
jgi:F-type H+-transporting ATPase subunit epsilon